jgi:hypothetical protein
LIVADRLAHARLALLASACLASFAAAQTPLAEDRAKGAATVALEHCKEWLGTLAGPEFEGRGTGQPGYQKAADYVAAHFKALGLEARGEGGTYFQHVPWTMLKVDAEKSFVRFAAGGAEVLTIPAARLSGTVSSALTASGDCVLLALDVPEAPARDAGVRQQQMPRIAGLDDLELTDKVVVVYLRQQGDRPHPMGHFAATTALQGKGAAAILFAQTEPVASGLVGRGGRRGGGGGTARTGNRRPAQPTFGGRDLDKLLAALDLTADALKALPTATPLKLQAELAIEVQEAPAPAMNVFAVLPGSDPAKKDEYVVVGSHLDHLGKNGDRVFPGADDDASGTTGVMAVAQMLAKNPVRPARSVLFVCFAGEESGLLGSAHFADNCPVPLASIVAELQMDMIGRDEEESAEDRGSGEKAEDNRNSLHLVGTKKLAPALHELCLERNGVAAFDLEWDHEGMFGRSDHANFARKGVPVAFFFTGLHRDYHQPSDTPEKIHYEKLLRVARYVYDITFELAMQPGRPEIDPELWAEYRKSERNRPPETPAAPLRK